MKPVSLGSQYAGSSRQFIWFVNVCCINCTSMEEMEEDTKYTC